MNIRNRYPAAGTDQLAAWRQALAKSKRHQRGQSWRRRDASSLRYRPGMARKQPSEAS